MTSLLKPYKTLAVGVIIGAVLWPVIRSKVG